MKTPGFCPGVRTLVSNSFLLVVVETTLARLVITFAPRRTALATPRRALVATGRRFETAGSRRRTAGEICTSVAHRATVARRTAAVTTAAAWSTATTVAATAAWSTATTVASTAAWSTATAATVAAAAAITTAAATTIATAAATTVAATSTAAAAAITTTAAATIAAATIATATTAAAVWRTRTAATAAAKSTAAATTAGLTLDRFAHRDRTTVEQCAVHGLHCCSTRFIGFHFEEGEAAAAARFAIHDHFRRGNSPKLGEGFLQTFGRDGVGQVAHKQFTTHSKLWAGGKYERRPARACWTIELPSVS
jgi:hypothetical protein